MDSDWRVFSKTSRERMGYIFAQSILTDFTIRIISSGMDFKVHSIILALNSAVFEDEIRDKIENGEPLVHEVALIDADIFRLLLNHVYQQDVHFTNVQQAWDLYAAAKHYGIHDLKNYCMDYIERNINSSNACYCFEMADKHQLDELKKRFLQFIQQKAKHVVADENFLSAKDQTVQLILDQELLSIKEYDLFKAVESWIKSKGEEQIETLSNLLIPKIRFMSMTAKEFVTGPFVSCLMKQSDINSVLANITVPDCGIPLPDGFSKYKRNLIAKEQIVSRKEVRIDSLNTSIQNFNNGTIILSVNKDTNLKGFSIFTLEWNPENFHTSYEEELKVELGMEGCIQPVCSTYKILADYSSNLFIQLIEPFKLIQDKKYRLYIQTKSGLRKKVNLSNIILSSEDVKFSFSLCGVMTPCLPISSICFVT